MLNRDDGQLPNLNTTPWASASATPTPWAGPTRPTTTTLGGAGVLTASLLTPPCPSHLQSKTGLQPPFHLRNQLSIK